MPISAAGIPLTITSGDSYVHRQIIRTNRNFIAVTLALVVTIVLVGGGLAWKAWYNLFAGPFRVEESAFGLITDPNTIRQYFVEFHPSAIWPTGLKETRERWRAKMTFDYLLVPIGDKFLLVKSPEGEGTTILRGTVRWLSTDDKEKLADLYDDTDPAVLNRLLPIELDGRPERAEGYIALATVLALCWFACWALRRALDRQKHPGRHPTVQALSAYGEFSTLSEEIEGEVRAPRDTVGNVIFTERWMLIRGLFSFDAMPLRSLVWAYDRKVDLRMTVIIPMVSYDLEFWTVPGRRHSYSGKRSEVARIKGVVADRVPWVLWGFDKAIEKRRRKDWESVVEEVRQRWRDATAQRTQP